MQPRRSVGMITAIAAFLLLFDPIDAGADEHHFVLIFGSQSQPKRLKDTHTWATFVRATGQGPNLAAYTLEAVTISWLPATLNIRVLAHDPEPGVNLELHATIRAMYAKGEAIMLWGPFVIPREVYQHALAQAQRLGSGQVLYRALRAPANQPISDCIDAVADINSLFGGRLGVSLRTGFAASDALARNVMARSPLEQRGQDHAWLIPRLGVDRYPIRVVSPRELGGSCVMPTPRPAVAYP